MCFAKSLGGGKKVAMALEEAYAVARGDVQVGRHIGQPALSGVQDIQQICRHQPEPVVFRAHSQFSPGRAFAARCEDTRIDDVGQGGGQVDRGAFLAGDVGTETLEGLAFVVVLASALVTVGDDPCWFMAQSDGGRDFVAMLPARPRGLVDIKLTALEERLVIQGQPIMWIPGCHNNQNDYTGLSTLLVGSPSSLSDEFLMDDYINNPSPENDWSDAEFRAHRAHRLYDEGRLTEAAEELQAAIAIDPSQPAWHFNLGLTYEAMDDIQAAIDCFQLALALDDSDVECLNCLAVNLTRLQRFDEALACYASIDRIDRGFEPAYCNRVATYSEMGDHEAAELAFYMARQIKDACPVCSYNLGNSYFVRGMLDHAVCSWQECLRLDPQHPHANVRLAEAYWQKRDLDAARECYKAQLRITPDDVDILLDYGELLVEVGAVDQARYRYELAGRFAPDSPAVYLCLGRLEVKLGNPRAALERFQQAILLAPTDPRGHLQVAKLALAGGDEQLAGYHLTCGLRYLPTDIGLLQEYSQTLMQARRVRDAHDVLAQLVELVPTDAVARHNLAVTCFEMGRMPEGIAHARQAIRLKPDYALASYNLAVALLQQGQSRRAMCHIRKGLAHEPKNPQLLDLRRKLRRGHHWTTRLWGRLQAWFTGR